MARMTESKMVGIRMSPEIRAALDEHCAKSGIKLSELLRDAALREIGRADLIEGMPSPGRPWPKAEPKQPALKRGRNKKG